MDICCPKCGEPWDLDSLHEEVKARFPDLKQGREPAFYKAIYDTVKAQFRQYGCSALGGACNTTVDAKAAAMSALAQDLMGSDLDGAASMLDDARYLGLFDE